MIFVCPHAYSGALDTLVAVRISKVLAIAPDTATFEIRLVRLADDWQKFANATFSLTLLDTTKFSDSKAMRLELLPSTSELPLSNFSTTALSAYTLKITVVKGRFSIAILGPDQFEDCVTIPLDTGLLVGKFKVYSTNKSELTGLRWSAPLERFQAFAYKRNQDSVADGIQWYSKDDNVQISASDEAKIKFIADDASIPSNQVRNFRARYIGDHQVELTWQSVSEAFNRGFMLDRGLVPFNIRTPDTIRYDVQVADYRRSEHATLLAGLGTASVGRKYRYIDTVPLRGETFSYKLLLQRTNDDIKFVDTANALIPNSTISSAVANPNPFKDVTTLEYYLEDRMIVSIYVSDQQGREVGRLLDKANQTKGSYKVSWNASAFSQQGLYNIVIVGFPVSDPSVEMSRAIVKVQLYR